MATAEPQAALDALLRASAAGTLEGCACAYALRSVPAACAEQSAPCRAAPLLCSVTFAADAVQFADGTRFPRDMLLTTSVDQPYRLDVLCFLAQFASRYPGVVNAAAYLKARAFRQRVAAGRANASFSCPPSARAQEARSAGVATVAITDRARVLAFLTTEGEGAPSAKRPRRAVGTTAAHPAERGDDDFLPMPEDIRLRDLAQLHDRNSILLSRNKVRAPLSLQCGAPAAALARLTRCGAVALRRPRDPA